MIPFTLWLALIWGSAINGVFRGGVAPFPLHSFAIFLPVIIGTPIVLLSKRMESGSATGQFCRRLPPFPSCYAGARGGVSRIKDIRQGDACCGGGAKARR